MRRPLLIIMLLVAASCAGHQPPTTNPSGCSDPLGLYTLPEYRPCCLAHDQAYAIGGSEPDRLAADRALMLCVARRSPDDAASMFVAVRLFGSSRFRYKETP